MKKSSLVLGLLAILLFAYDLAIAVDRQFSVFVGVPIKNELTDTVKNISTRELQKLPDIKLADELSHENGQYVISIVAVPFKPPNHLAAGVVLSYVFQDGGQVVHGVLTGSFDDLEKLSELVVSIFDVSVLEPDRHK